MRGRMVLVHTVIRKKGKDQPMEINIQVQFIIFIQTNENVINCVYFI